MPAAGAAIGFITFIASMISRVSPASTVCARRDERRRAGLGRQEDGADHRRLDRAGMAGGADIGGGGPRAAAAAGAAPEPAAAGGCGGGRDGDACASTTIRRSPSSTSISLRSFSSSSSASWRTRSVSTRMPPSEPFVIGSSKSLSLLPEPRPRSGALLSETGGRVQSKLIAERAEAGDRSPAPPARSRLGGGSSRAPAGWTDGPRSPAASIAFTASCSATEVWVKPPALRITALAPCGLRLVQPVDQMALMVGLAELDLERRAPRARSSSRPAMSSSVSAP